MFMTGCVVLEMSSCHVSLIAHPFK